MLGHCVAFSVSRGGGTATGTALKAAESRRRRPARSRSGVVGGRSSRARRTRSLRSTAAGSPARPAGHGANPERRLPDLRHHGRRLCCRTRSEEHTSELQSLMRISYAVFCLKKKKTKQKSIKYVN